MYYEIFTSDSMQEPPVTTMAKGGKLKIGGDDFSFLLELSDDELSKRLDLVRKQQNINGEQYFAAINKKESTQKIEDSRKNLDNQEKAIIEARLIKYDKRHKMAKGGSLDMDKVTTKYATQDVNLLQKEGGMAITDTKMGVIFGEYKLGKFEFTNRNGDKLFSGNKQEAIDFVKNNYQVDSMAKGGMMAKGGEINYLKKWRVKGINMQGKMFQKEITLGRMSDKNDVMYALKRMPDTNIREVTLIEEIKEDGGMMAKGGRLSRKQKQLDLNKNGKLDSQDFKMLRAGRKNARKK
jgi:hypothetical protein